ncbi:MULTISPECIES: endonuclease/exonuclease/phosphatase family protein [Exiguobacterium]|uniref:endonuclease/exonuclease/phosphatase family protein n=1 Tax=Exiguobacterium TaxID=33986 RepID=UPI0009913769|nr:MULTISPECIES: endonuclease/exonuclease/phosphatase family protein [Exiguobacterium]
MRIATYNIWNHDTSWQKRIDAICQEVKRIDADLIALQEVRSYEKGSVAHDIAEATGYPFCVFHPYPDSPDEGLAFLSNIPLSSVEAIWAEDVEESNYCATRVTLTFGGQEWGITNVHLNWHSSSIRECQMKVVRDWLSKGRQKAIEVLCGDFNDHPRSNIYDDVSDAGWLDVTTFVGEEARPTLDVKHNPYLQSSHLEQPERYDWILVRSECSELEVQHIDIFGDMRTSRDVVPSDHYGVMVDFTLN